MKRPFVLIFFFSIAISMFSIFYQDVPDMDSMISGERTSIQCIGTVKQVLEKQNSTALYLKEVKILSINGREPEEQEELEVGGLLVYEQSQEKILSGNQVRICGSITKFDKGTNPGQFNEFIYYKGLGLDYRVFADEITVTDSGANPIAVFAQKIRLMMKKNFDAYLSEDTAGVMSAMLLGDKTTLPEDVKELYQKNGIGHILAISGLHVSLIGMCFYRLLKKLYIPNETAIPLSLLVLYLYGIMTGFSVSTNRAVVMLGLSLLSILLGRTYDFLSGICVSGTLILLQNPYQLLNCGFLLSFGAVIAIAILYPCILELCTAQSEKEEPLQGKGSSVRFSFLTDKKQEIDEATAGPWKNKIRGLFRGIGESLLISLSINVMTLPVLSYFYFDIPVYCLLLNVLILSIVPYLIGFGFVVGICGSIFVPFGVIGSYGVEGILNVYSLLCNLILQLPKSVQTLGRPQAFLCFLYFGCCLAFCLCYQRWRKKGLVCILLFAIVLLLIPQPKKDLEITMMDVGQGDGILIQQKQGVNCLIDGGSTSEDKVGKYRMIPCLKSKRITSLQYVFVTHTDEDHISGISELLEKSGEPGEILIEHLVMPDTTLVEESYEALVALAKTRGVPVIYLKKGDKIESGQLSLECIHPYEGFETTEKNDYSTVLLLNYFDFSMLFTGDVANEGEQALIENEQLGHCDIYKVSHHGSKYTNSETLLDQLTPECAVVSAGEGNRYGHPHKEVLERLQQRNCTCITTIDYGALTIQSDGSKVTVDGMTEKKGVPWLVRKRLLEFNCNSR